MAGMLEFDQLCRIREATERAARQVGNMVPLSAYNNLVALYNTLSAQHHALATERDTLKEERDHALESLAVVRRNRDEFEAWGHKALENLKLTEKELSEERRSLDLVRGERDRAKADLKTLQAKYDDLYVKGRANRDWWKARAEKAEAELAALRASMRPTAASVA